MKRMKKTQKLRVIVNGVSFYTTAAQVRYGIGDMAKVNAATQKALDALEFQRDGGLYCSGLAGVWEGLQVQVDMTQ